MTNNNDTPPSSYWIDDLGKLLLRPDAPSVECTLCIMTSITGREYPPDGMDCSMYENELHETKVVGARCLNEHIFEVLFNPRLERTKMKTRSVGSTVPLWSSRTNK